VGLGHKKTGLYPGCKCSACKLLFTRKSSWLF